MNNPASSADAKLDALFAAGRMHRPETARAEFGFETRLMSRLRSQVPAPLFSAWAVASWRMIPILGVCVLFLAVWEAQVSTQEQEAQQMADLKNPDVSDLFASFD